MKRRTYLAASGTGALATLTGCLGLFGGSSNLRHPGNMDAEFTANADLPGDDDVSDGYPPEYGDPESREIDESRFRSLSANGETVTLVPLDVVRYWHERSDARFVDARGLDQYRTSHIYGAVNSTYTQDSSGGGISGWDEDTRVVCYCGCPHHMSSLRAAGLQKAGYSNVYVFDEGFFEWRDRDLPMRGTGFDAAESASVIEGEVAESYAGEYAWATRVDADQREAAPIADDGSFEIHLRFAELTPDTRIRVETPEFDVTGSLGDLTATVLTG